MNEFERLLLKHYTALERYIKYKINNKHDAEDIIQDVCLTATMRFATLRSTSVFKAWLIGIATHKCNDYYRQKAKDMNISLEVLSESVLHTGRCGIMEYSIVRDTLDMLGDKEQQILYLYFFKNCSQEEIARRLSIPLGTVKSRLHYAKRKFKEHYPHKPSSKGESTMKKLPELLPEYQIIKSDLAPFNVIHEELPGMFIIPRMGETISFGIYDMPERNQNGIFQLNVTGKIAVHGIEGVTIQKKYQDDSTTEESTIFAQLTDTRCRYLGGVFTDQNGTQRITTFLDSDFHDNYGIGEDNCGFLTHRTTEGKIAVTNQGLILPTEDDISDIVGRYTVTINGTSYDTVRLIDYQNSKKGGMVCEHYLDKNGRAILWRRFNRIDWAYSRYGKLWTEMLPGNETLTINGVTYVHWYDCVTDYIF